MHLLQLYTTCGIIAGAAGSLLYLLEKSVSADELVAHPAKNVWPHSGYFSSFDAARLVQFLSVLDIGFCLVGFALICSTLRTAVNF